MHVGFDPVALLRCLDAHGVRHVVIGGFAAWMHGAPIVTADLDVVYDPAPDNLARLMDALVELEAVYRHQHGRRIAPEVAGLASTVGAGHHLLETRHGHLDLLRTVAGAGYEALCGEVDWYDIDGVRTPLVRLQRIIELKAAAGRPKDLAALPTLRAALDDDDEV